MVKLSTGREFNGELKEITKKQSLRISIRLAQNDPDIYFDTVCIGLGLSEKELEESDYTLKEIGEIAGLVFEKMALSDVQKKS